MATSFGELFGKLVLALASLAGVFGGLAIYVFILSSNPRYYISPAGCLVAATWATIIAIAVVGLWLGERLMSERPRFARWLIEMWLLFSVPAGALAIAFLLYIVLHLNGALTTPPGLTKEQAKQIYDLVDGAFAAFIASFLIKDIADGTGVFSVSARFKQALRAAGPRFQPPLQRQTPAHQAIYNEGFIAGRGDVGWAYSGRGLRADALGAYVDEARAAKKAAAAGSKP